MTASTRSSIPSVSHARGRPSDYTPEEDAIILKHRDTKEVQRLLAEAGFAERSAAAIWSRRKYLGEVGASGVTQEMVGAHDLLPLLSARRQKLRERLRMLDEERERLVADIESISAEMHALIDG